MSISISKIISKSLSIRLGTNVNQNPIPDGAIVTKDGSMIILTTGSDYILTVNGFVPLNALMVGDNAVKTLNNQFITI